MKTTNKFKTPSTLSISFIAIALISAITCFSSCSKNDNQVMAGASVMAVNSAQASAPQDFYVDNTKENSSGIAYTQSSGYFIVGTGSSHSIQFKTSSTSTVNATTNDNFAPGGFYTVFYTDNSGTASYQDDRTAPQGPDARVRFINLSSAMTASADFASTVGGKSTGIASNVAYQAATSYYELSAMATTFTFSATGSSTVLLNIPVTLLAGKIYTIFISGSTSATITYTLVAEN